MEKVLFLIHDLGGGGAEKVLVNLVSRMDRTRYDVTVIALFACLPAALMSSFYHPMFTIIQFSTK